MEFQYKKNFKNFTDNQHPDGIWIENYADHPNQLGFVLCGNYNITFPGNKHLLMSPEISNFELKLYYAFNKLYSDQQGIIIYFHYNKCERKGLAIHLNFCKTRIELKYGIQDGVKFEELESRSFISADPGFLELTLKGKNIQLKIGEQIQKFVLTGKDIPVKGFIGFDRYAFNGPLIIRNIELNGECNDISSQTIWPKHYYKFPEVLSGFDSEWEFGVKAEKRGKLLIIDLDIEGGPAKRKQLECFEGRMPNEELFNPYFKVSSKRYEQKIYIFKGKVGLKGDWNKGQPGRGPADIQCPVKRQIIFDKIPENAKIYLGYESYWREDRIDIDTPWEMLLEPSKGKFIEAQEYLRENDINIDLKSQADKKISSLIDRQDLRYDYALAFARNNHYFYESEVCQFNFEVSFKKTDYSQEELSFSYQLKDVFYNPLTSRIEYQMNGNDNAYDPSQLKLTGQVICFDTLKTGVYHLTLEARINDKILKQQSFAFEIMDESNDNECAPLKSGLPKLFSHCSDNNTDSDYFDPWLGKNNNMAHYYSNCCYTAPVARKFRIWNLIHTYQRKWFMWLKARTSKTPEYKDNIEEIKNADYTSFEKLQGTKIYDNERIDLSYRTTYTGKILELLFDFIKKEKINLKILNLKAINKIEQLSPEAFEELLSNSELWKKWMLFICDWRQNEFHPERIALARKINKNIKFIDYAPFPYYVATYRGSYCMLFSGFDLRMISDSFKDSIFWTEDYPFLIGYPIQRSIYSFSAFKLEAPQLKLFPEIYSFCAIPCDVAVRYGSPPYGISSPDAVTIKKRIFEYAYAVCWYRDGAFAFWKDYGFHLRTPSNSGMEVFLKSWNIVNKFKPVSPLRTTAFVTSIDCCLKHPDLNTETSYAKIDGWKDYINTAEEFPAYIYEQSRITGILNGFLIRPEDIATLTSKEVHTLVLPPLSTLTKEQKNTARSLYDQGVNLVCSECVDGFEDIFGVDKVPETVVKKIYPEGTVASLKGRSEFYVDSRCVSSYKCNDAQIILHGQDESQNVLSINRGKKANAVLFATAPTLIRRKGLYHKVSRGSAVISDIINSATRLIMREINNAPVTTSQGKLIGFKDENNNLHIIVTEDAHPAPAKAISPLVTIYRESISEEMLSCDHNFSIISIDKQKATIRLHIKANDAAVITVKYDGDYSAQEK